MKLSLEKSFEQIAEETLQICSHFKSSFEKTKLKKLFLEKFQTSFEKTFSKISTYSWSIIELVERLKLFEKILNEKAFQNKCLIDLESYEKMPNSESRQSFENNDKDGLAVICCRMSSVLTKYFLDHFLRKEVIDETHYDNLIFPRNFAKSTVEKSFLNFSQNVLQNNVLPGEVMTKLQVFEETVKKQFQTYLKSLTSISDYASFLDLHKIFTHKNDPNKLGIMHVNMQSVNDEKKFNRLVTNLVLLEKLPNVICITETFFNLTKSLENYRIPNFSLYVRSRAEVRGGVAMYINNSFKVLERQDLTVFEDKICESLCLEIITDNEFNFICGVVYWIQKIVHVHTGI